MHREENVDYEDNLTQLLESLNSIAEIYKIPVIVSTHPRTKNRIDQLGKKVDMNNLIIFSKPLGFFDYIKLQLSAKCVISDSGTITEESSILNFPAIMIRSAHERPEGMDNGTLIMSGLQSDSILQAIKVVIELNKTARQTIIPDYDVDNVSQKVVKIIFSYTEYINNFIWKKNVSLKSVFK
jgi:UDP-N-acetylglucosamine 2-epimerase (non-hydrolysing)